MKISVVIPVFNAACHLQECLASVCAQSFSDWEAVCVDDGSTDESGRILEKFAAKDRRIGIVHQKNAGAWAARNTALGVTKGEWLTFVDADDVLNPNWLQSYVDLIKNTDADIVRQRFVYGRSLPENFECKEGKGGCELLRGSEARAWMWNTMAKSGFVWCCCVRREIVKGVRFLPKVNCKEDSLWLLEITPRIQSVAQGEFEGYFYRATEGSLMKRKRKVSQCVSYLKAMLSLWRDQHEDAAKDGYEDIICRNIRASVDNDVIEWAMMRATEDDMLRSEIGEAYRQLELAGVLMTPYSNRKRYRIGIWWWRRTGQIWAIRIPGLLFLYLRRVINSYKKFESLKV